MCSKSRPARGGHAAEDTAAEQMHNAIESERAKTADLPRVDQAVTAYAIDRGLPPE